METAQINHVNLATNGSVHHQNPSIATPDSQLTETGKAANGEQQISAQNTINTEPQNSVPTVTGSPQNPVPSNATQVSHATDDIVGKNTSLPQTMKEWGSCKKWSESQWMEFKLLVDAENTGEEFMKMLGFTRRKDLDLVYYEFSKREGQIHEPKWEVDFENGEHALPSLRFNKSGLTLSSTRLKRHGLKVPPNTFVTMEVIQPDKIELIVHLK